MDDIAPTRSDALLAVLALVSLASNHVYQSDRARTPDWIAVNTTFGNVQKSDGPLAEFSIAEQIQRSAFGTSGRVIIFPEMVVGNWGEGADLFWRPKTPGHAEPFRPCNVRINRASCAVSARMAFARAWPPAVAAKR